MYYAGKSLEKKVAEYDLQELDKLLTAVLEGQQGWPGQLSIPVEDDLLEGCRKIIYSLLHSKGLKDVFVVKADLAHNRLLIDRKDSVQKKRTGGIVMVELPGTASPADYENPEVPEMD